MDAQPQLRHPLAAFPRRRILPSGLVVAEKEKLKLAGGSRLTVVRLAPAADTRRGR